MLLQRDPRPFFATVALILSLTVSFFGSLVPLSYLSSVPALRYSIDYLPEIGPVAALILALLGAATATVVVRPTWEGTSRSIAMLAMGLLGLAESSELIQFGEPFASALHIRQIPAYLLVVLGAGLLLASSSNPMANLVAGALAVVGVAVSLFACANLLNWLFDSQTTLLFDLSPQSALLQLLLSVALGCLSVSRLQIKAGEKREGTLLVAVAGIAMAFTFTWMYVSWDDSVTVRKEAQQETRNVSLLLEEHFRRGLDPIELVFNDVERTLALQGLDELANSKKEWERLKDVVDSLPQMSALVVLDAAGKMRFFSNKFGPANTDFSHREYFAAHKKGERHYLGGLMTSGSGKRVFSYSRRFDDADGQFGGVIFASIELAYFQDFYRSIDLGSGSALSLFKPDGTLLFREPMLPESSLPSLKNHPIYARLIHLHKEGTFVGHSPFDGEQKLVNYRLAGDRSFVVNTAKGMEAIVFPFQRRLIISATVLAAVLALLSLVALVHLRQIRQEAKLLGAEESKRRFMRSVLDSVSSSIAILDSAGKIRDVNAAWCNFSSENGGKSREDYIGTDYLAVCRDATGPEAGAAGSVADGISSVITGTKHSFEYTYPCHGPQERRWYRMRVTPMNDASGSVVVSHESVTDLKMVEETLRVAANTDLLTGLCNRRALVEMAGREFAQMRRQDGALSLMIVDWDYFKRINDTFGHDAGDAVLKQLALTMKSVCRSGDILGRIGGEEFVAILPYTAIDGARVLAERLREAVACSIVEYDGVRIQGTISIGVAAWHPGMSLEELMKTADEFLYKAKSGGRNRVETRVEAAVPFVEANTVPTEVG